jgi:hypothetical protein
MYRASKLTVYATLVALSAGPLRSLDNVSTGVVLLQPVQYNQIPSVPPTFAPSGVPTSVDLEKQFPPPRQQAPQQSCAAWVVGYAITSYLKKLQRHWDYSDDTLFSPAFIYNQLNTDPSCQGRLTLPDAMNIVTTEGIAPLSAFPYMKDNCIRRPDDAVIQTAGRFFAAGFRRVNFLDDGEMKRLLVQGRPIAVALMIASSFVALARTAIYASMEEDETTMQAHALVIVGYDNARQAYRVMNSWGTEWADGGFGWISFAAFRHWAREAYVLYDVAEGPTATIANTTLVQIVTRADQKIGIATTTRSTGDNHCSLPFGLCAGEPTRRNYQLLLESASDAELRNPRLTCISGPCEGWNEVHDVHLENQGRRVVASFDTWSHPTTWQLTADQVKLDDVLHIWQRVKRGDTFEVRVKDGLPPPRIEGTAQDGTRFVFEAGKPIQGNVVQEVERRSAEDSTILIYRLVDEPGFRG